MSLDAGLAGQTVLVIGGSSGIGLETARRARSEGADVILTAREASRLHHAGLELGASIAAFDATDLQRLGRFFGALPVPIDHVLLSGPAPCHRPRGSREVEAARSGGDLSVPLSVARNAAAVVRPGGSLLFLGTTGGRAVPGLAFTVALRAIVKPLAVELAPVRVNLIAVGIVDPADVGALAVDLMANTSVTGATIEIEGGQRPVER